ncbi:putative oxidoreductase-like protein [Hapsidospora chrysogenum ATCC 11550]|uniref:Putative oxidoreductase-like protein n=1 Tax=Hapsidospora chrysogenum (strain ATCC 11550 / CBS 779.69 / DSM 880 / IAM 14645 / JCM 23072 / IMI 49137) TaxID=857340 RepID=A0A086T5E5_HAPC1|nr:putative oxidoreductase-like protein [Hapsidospora chrysogenum ATCC 11550]
MASTPTLLWVGLGNMGRGMCKNIVEKGSLKSPLLLFNRSRERAVELSAKLTPGRTQVVETMTEGVTRADIVFTCLANDEAVEEFVAKALESDVTGKLFVECSTIHPDTTDAIAKAVVARGAEFVAAPVFGAPAAAEAGQLIGVLAGPKSSVGRARPWFKGVMAKAEVDMSDQPYGKATTLKVLGNTFILAMVEQLAEAHVVAEKSGLDTDLLHQFVDGFFGGAYAAYSTRMLRGVYHKEGPFFGVDLARKDARHAMSLASAAGARLKIVEIGDAHLAQVQEHSGSAGDIAGIYGAAREEAGLKFENDA